MPLIKTHRFNQLQQYGLFFLWLLVIVGCVIYSSNTIVNGYKFDSSILNLLPVENRSKAKQFAENKLSILLNQQIVLLLKTDAKTDSTHIAQNIEVTLKNSAHFKKVEGDLIR